ncbi:hypothetical protein BDQ12DRAFT_723855 [Crucibulum laeve]|uniref:MalT-like TPR region domain-containing protein n=1 Tax=Crucibulum laeve TaxID=68775 RepID=A0A5C3LYL6_9AGAR|nr:hypothetical protein BDQ12DRAFT_723855 [Crucibulum laeve]
MAFMSLSEAPISCGYINGALHSLNESEALARGTGNPLLESMCILIRARAYMLLGRLEEASMLCDHAIQTSDALGLNSFAAVERMIQRFYADTSARSLIGISS